MGLKWKSVWCACNYPRNSFWQFFLQNYSKTKGDLGALPALYSEPVFRAVCPGINPGKGFISAHSSSRAELLVRQAGQTGPAAAVTCQRFAPAHQIVTLLAAWACTNRMFLWQVEEDIGHEVQWMVRAGFLGTTAVSTHTLYSLNSRIK